MTGLLSIGDALQGPTSTGKTSLVSYLAAQTGHRCVRINNHEQTDLQEYLGSYVADENGRLVFREGALVTAVRKGHWVVLDELNLAPSEVLEALNRQVLWLILSLSVISELSLVSWEDSGHSCAQAPLMCSEGAQPGCHLGA